MIPNWVKYSFFTKMATCDICGEREMIATTSKKYIEGQMKIFAKEHEHGKLSQSKTLRSS